MRIHAAAAATILILGIWLSSGTLAPYAAAVAHPPLVEPCHYPVSVDHLHHLAPFLMLAGYPPERWQASVVLRRILYPIAAYPFVLTGGFLAGGLVANMVFSVAAQLLLARSLARRFGHQAGVATLWLLATYPGITYWAGLPYGYAAIVPASAVCMVLLYRIYEARRMREVAEAALLTGVASLAYDLLPFFLPAMLVTLVVRRRPGWALTAAAFAVLPSLVVAGTYLSMGLRLMNSNSSIFGVVLGSYLHPVWSSEWRTMLLRFPGNLAGNYLFSNFLFLPLLFIALLVIARVQRVRAVQLPDLAMLGSTMLLFAFNNVAPPYEGWQMRGLWIARLYQPVFIVMLFVTARVIASAPRAILPRAIVVATVVANALVVLGPVTDTPLGPYLYHRFYMHSPVHVLRDNVRIYGRRPLGVCHAAHDLDAMAPVQNPSSAARRPGFMYRYPDEGGR